jgi:hypothetical protein
VPKAAKGFFGKENEESFRIFKDIQFLEMESSKVIN